MTRAARRLQMVRVGYCCGVSTSPLPRRTSTIPGFVSALLTAGAIAAMPIIARHVDGSADEFTGRRFAVLPALGWVVCAALLAVVVTRWLQRLTSVEAGPGLALAYDGLPVLLVAAWGVALLAGLTGHWLLATVAGALCGYHVALLVPRLLSSVTPPWVRHAPRFRLLVANVFIDNKTPEAAAQQLVESGSDVVIIVESTRPFMTLFDRLGGRSAYPTRVFDPDDTSDYAVTIATSHELGPRSEVRVIGPLRVAIADIEVGGVATLVVALNPMATVDPNGLETWKQQIAALAELLPTLAGPMVVAGDLNTTRYRPGFEEILALGLHDAIDSLGKGLNPSFKVSASGPLAVAPLVRLDHALADDDVHSVAMRNLDACGSDHVPFEIELAVRPPHAHRHLRHARPRPDDAATTPR